MLQDKHIVVIDDAEVIRRFLRISLEAHGAIVQAAATAAGGLAYCEQAVPDLVILDLGLPDSDGVNILSRLKKLGGEGGLPVIILTVRNDPNFMQHMLSMGADKYLTKPCFVEDVIKAVEEVLGLREEPKPQPQQLTKPLTAMLPKQ